MFKNYLKIALRNFLKHKGFSLINVFGLATGIACCLMIVLFVLDEISFDRYHEKAYQRQTDHHAVSGRRSYAFKRDVQRGQKGGN